MDQTDGTDGSVDIGVSLSGGGHRATLFGLGVLLYLAHAHDERDKPLSRRVSAISSVSGGSITNGFLAQSLDYREAEADQVEVAAQTLATQLAEHGVLFARRRVKAYAIALCGLATLGVLGLAAGLTLRTGGSVGRKRQVEFLFRLDPPPTRWVTNFLSRDEQHDAMGRAEAVLEVLARVEPDTANVVTTWRERAARNAAMRTTLSRVPPEVAAQLIEHGYALAMARLHILQGYPLIDLPPRRFFRRLAGSEATRAEE